MTTFEIYRQVVRGKPLGYGDWRWRAKRKGRIVADSGEGYKRRGGVVKSIRHLLEDLQLNRYRTIQGGREVDL